VLRCVRLSFRGLTPSWLRCLGYSSLTVPREVSWFIVIIVVTLNFLLKCPWGLSGLTILLRRGFRYLIYLVGVAFLLLGCGDVLPFRRDAFNFLRPAPEVIV
jgi:hypothetical protein